MMRILWPWTQSGTSRWCRESLFLHWERREALMWTLWCSSKMGLHLIAWTELLNTSGSTSQETDSFCIESITSGHPILQILTSLTIFCGGTWKTEFMKTIHRHRRFSKILNFRREIHKKCSIELWTILMFKLLLSYNRAAPGSNILLITSIVKHYWF